MSNNNYADSTIQAIETIVDQKLNTIAFDKTETCTIISNDEEDKQRRIQKARRHGLNKR